MNIDLPRRNLKTQNFVVKEGTLYIRNRFFFKPSVQQLTYSIKGRRKCFYCGLDFPISQMTLDHVYPKIIGGPYIPNNLVPCCQMCNGMKADMTAGQYFQFKRISKTENKVNFVKDLNHTREKLRKDGKSELPKNWIEQIPTKEIRFHTIKIKERAWNKKQEIFLACNGHIPQPIVVDQELKLIDGFHWLIIARQYNLETVPVIRLENVKIINKRSFEILLLNGQ